MIKGIGTDIVSNDRLKKDILRFSNYVLSESEREKFNCLTSEKAKICFLGGRFACKEAIFKATNYLIDFKKIDIFNDEAGKPMVKMDIEGKISISISHEETYSVAFAIYED